MIERRDFLAGLIVGALLVTVAWLATIAATQSYWAPAVETIIEEQFS